MKKPLITEADIRRAHAAGTGLDTRTALVTPAARDLARSLGVRLDPTDRSVSTPPRSTTAHGTVVAIGADHGGYSLKSHLIPVIERLGFTVVDVGTDSTDPVDYPVFAARVADEVATDRAAFGIVVDGAGIGSAMVANKTVGVRAALCYDLTTAGNAREHNNANVLTLGGTLIGPRLAGEIVTTFLRTTFAAGRHARRVAMIDALDRNRRETGPDLA